MQQTLNASKKRALAAAAGDAQSDDDDDDRPAPAAAAKKARAEPIGAGSGDNGSSSSSGGKPGVVQLGGQKRVEVSKFKVSLRALSPLCKRPFGSALCSHCDPRRCTRGCAACLCCMHVVLLLTLGAVLCLPCVQSFILVDIREMYTNKTSGEELPGKKGISLRPEQWATLLKNADKINEAIAKMQQ